MHDVTTDFHENDTRTKIPLSTSKHQRNCHFLADPEKSRAETKLSEVRNSGQSSLMMWGKNMKKLLQAVHLLISIIRNFPHSYISLAFAWFSFDAEKEKCDLRFVSLTKRETWAPLWVWHQQNDGCMFSTLQLLQQKVHILNESKHFCRYSSALTILTWWQWTHQQFEISETDDKLMCTLQKKRAWKHENPLY